jgi:N-terminal domain from the human glycogen debranching enzyme
MSSEGKTVSVTINHGVFDDSKLYRLKKSTVLRIVPGESLLGKCVSIQTNYPANQNDFVRTKFVSLEWFSRYGERLSTRDNYADVRDLEMYCQVTMLRSGTFRFYILEEDKCVKFIKKIMKKLTKFHFYFPENPMELVDQFTAKLNRTFVSVEIAKFSNSNRFVAKRFCRNVSDH